MNFRQNIKNNEQKKENIHEDENIKMKPYGWNMPIRIFSSTNQIEKNKIFSFLLHKQKFSGKW